MARGCGGWCLALAVSACTNDGARLGAGEAVGTSGGGSVASAGSGQQAMGATGAGASTGGATSGASGSNAGGSANTGGRGGTATPTGDPTSASGSSSLGGRTSNTTAGAGGEPATTSSDAGAAGTTSTSVVLDGPYPDMEVWSHVDTFEMAPVVLAADSVYPGNLTVQSGGMADLFNENEALVATNADTVALRFSVDNPNLRIVFTVCESYYRIVARRSAGIETLADLAGKNVSVIAQTSAAYFLHRMLDTVGLSEDDVVLSNSFGSVPQLLADGDLDAVSAWEPDPQRAVNLLGDDAIEFRNLDVYREMVNVNTTQENLDDPVKRATIVGFVKSLIVAAEQVRNDPESVWPIMERDMGFDQELIEQAWFIQEYRGTLAPDLLDVMVDEEVWLAGVQGRTPRTRQELAPLVDPSILEEAWAP